MKIAWAVDPFAEDDLVRSAAWAIRGLSEGKGAEVHPFCVWSTGPYEIPLQGGDDFLEELRARAQDELESHLTRVQLGDVRPVEVIYRPALSAREAAEALVERAKELDLELIVIGTHGRKGLRRLWHGSFAETLTLVSDVPLLVVHGGIHRAVDFDRILFPTDFSDESMEAFERALHLAARSHGRSRQLILYHKVHFPDFPPYDLASSAAGVLERAFELEAQAARERMAEMAAKAASLGVPFHAIVDTRRFSSPADAVLRISRRHSCLIAMSARSGRMRSVLLGGTARRVVREASVPVWVVHPHPKAASRMHVVDTRRVG